MEYQLRLEADFHNEYYIWDAYDSFQIPDPSLEMLFDEWIEQVPQSWAAYAARAQYYEAWAGFSRGDKWISETTTEQIEAMTKYLLKAQQDAEKALEINPKAIICYGILMGIAGLVGSDEQEEAYFMKALKQCPYCFIIRTTRITGLTPRWGGSYEEMNDFASECERFLPQNPRLAVLRGYVYWDKARSLRETPEAKKMKIELYSKALSYGDHWRFYLDRGLVFSDQEEYSKALEDLNKSIGLRPQRPLALNTRGFVYYQLNQRDKARADFALSYQLNPIDPYTQKWANFFQFPPN